MHLEAAVFYIFSPACLLLTYNLIMFVRTVRLLRRSEELSRKAGVRREIAASSSPRPNGRTAAQVEDTINARGVHSQSELAPPQPPIRLLRKASIGQANIHYSFSIAHSFQSAFFNLAGSSLQLRALRQAVFANGVLPRSRLLPLCCSRQPHEARRRVQLCPRGTFKKNT